MSTQNGITEESIFAIERPDPSLFRYYLLTSLVLGPLFFIPLIPLYFRFHTLRYRFDSEGISMRWGILFRKEINLTYARIQDIHLRSNVIERWLGLARIEVQTASGSSGAEMVLEGLLQYEGIRDYLYSRMRGGGGGDESRQAIQGKPSESADAADLAVVMREVAAEIRALRETLQGRGGGSADG